MVFNVTIILLFIVTIIVICTVAIMLIFTTTTMVMVWCGAGDVLGGAEPPGRLLVQGGPGRPHGQRQRIDSTCIQYTVPGSITKLMEKLPEIPKTSSYKPRTTMPGE